MTRGPAVLQKWAAVPDVLVAPAYVSPGWDCEYRQSPFSRAGIWGLGRGQNVEGPCSAGAWDERLLPSLLGSLVVPGNTLGSMLA